MTKDQIIAMLESAVASRIGQARNYEIRLAGLTDSDNDDLLDQCHANSLTRAADNERQHAGYAIATINHLRGVSPE